MKKAIIYWFSEAEGGRKARPTGTEYHLTTEILEGGNIVSLSIKFDRANPTQNKMIDNCEGCFLFDHAPQHLLSSNAKLIICEGPHKVGKLVIK
ncbi:hypothetical protein [Lysinibacillus parviboronicapiens]|uniref:hypothetical protein n=1 Tax=Lysinibacillus parviboronicapiens TaxID=436516 RepID=UPI000D37BC1B|nr:hypothetical protein [Lysinibacillus parviboronicapiens]